MREVKAIIRPQRLDAVMRALHEIPGMPGVTISKVHAFARARPDDAGFPPEGLETDLIKLETIVADTLAPRVVDTIQRTAHTGRPGDGMIFVSAVEEVVRIRSGERGMAAL